MAKKMCKYAAQDCMGLNYRYMFKSCPKAANHTCEIVTKKPKAKVVKIKAALTHIPKVGMETQMVSINLKAIKAGWIPVTIHISAKDYARLKGGKK